MNTIIVCPNCKHQISIDDALSHQVKESLEKKYQKQRDEERQQERQKMRLWQEDQQKRMQEETEKEKRLLNEDLQKAKKQIEESNARELELLKKQKEIEEREKNLELEKERQIATERIQIEEKVTERLSEEHRLKMAEMQKQADDMKKKIDELQLKANLTSQQLQGEVLEIELEEFLKREFPTDEIKPVAKGVKGADVLQIVKDPIGKVAGTIIWESKRTKHWSEEWLQKLKDDMRVSGADSAILVSTTLPQGIKYFGPKDGVFITCFECVYGVSSHIRSTLIKENQIKNSVVGKNEKMEVLWSYLSSSQFSQKIDALVESFSTMKEDLEKEKRMFTQIWAKREKQIERVINNALGMHGELQGLMGSSLPELESIELTSVGVVETVSIDDVSS